MTLLRRLFIVALPICALVLTTPASVAAPQSNGVMKHANVDKQAFQSRLGKLGIQVLDVQPADIDGLVEVHTNGGVLYATPNAEKFIAGTLYGMDGSGNYVDLLAKRQAPLNAKKIAAERDDMIEYKADNQKYVITVFTDITCGYCAKLHSQMKEYNDEGITVRYLAFPRQGPHSEVASQMASIWCDKDPAAAMDQAKQSHSLPKPSANIAQCKQEVAHQFQLGQSLGVNGTPAIFLPNGEMVGGYLPPKQLLARLQQS
ncbi:bifunctional protein-disulfide isomerase/oxidoreductase DsbC [Vibrio palustris]|uniref:Thiol:disulfide interchange protein n=1 Tax=Vibrio palustris TaxID=1918946 RepID=A0A1R4B8W0_9VIBR|nr:bifunctional protein-disulfide isomerase/oxidoreductase DsbC [Vibrio palustris]SJL85363.1 Thiol:disulfide interchange protein DsbC precursor [Vibrio palustris]